MDKTADLLGIASAESVRQWFRKSPSGGGAATVSPDAGDEIRRLKKENAELKRANGITHRAGLPL